jgi:hypothetical protein
MMERRRQARDHPGEGHSFGRLRRGVRLYTYLMQNPTLITVKEHRKFEGYVLDEDTLRRIECLTADLIRSRSADDTANVKTVVLVQQTNGSELEYDSAAALIERAKDPQFQIKRIYVKSQRAYDASVSVQF